MDFKHRGCGWCPGWMYQVKCGATTTWECWDALKPDGTVNEEKIESSWKYEEDGCHITLSTPVKSEVVLPDGKKETVEAGTYHWIC